MPDNTSRDLVLALGEYAYVLDSTKGHINVYVGSNKTPMSPTDFPVKYEQRTRRFVKCDMEQAIQAFPNAPEGHYMVLTNPSFSKDEAHPKEGTSSIALKLDTGRKINIPGPAYFPLWPGQVADVIEGHRLRSNQYLIVRIYNEEEAAKNWGNAVIKQQATPTGETVAEAENAATVDPKTLVMGQLLVIRGTEISFYIPPTGVEVLADDKKASLENKDKYIRDAVTLERLEYCVLKDEDGNKRYVKGPAVVFPKPTEVFIENNSTRNFRAIELSPISAIHVKVIAEYKDEAGEHKVGEELFIKGSEQPIYYPRPEHALIKYGEQQDIHYAVAVPAGEGRYLLDRLKGNIKLVVGPKMLMPDPRTEVIVQRVLDPRLVKLMYPGNEPALEFNRQLGKLTEQKPSGEFLTSRETEEILRGSQYRSALKAEAVPEFHATEAIRRKTTFTPPRTITLDTKYQGAVAIEVWTGYAVLITSRSGKRRVVVGPQTALLEFDETPTVLELSRHVPKSDADLLRTVYLRVTNNRVSDEVEVETSDMFKMKIRLAYRVNFTGEDSEKWFAVENYTQYLAEHVRSMLKNAAKQYGVEKFYADAINIIRDTVLGLTQDDKPRSGRLFTENGMHIYDVDIDSVFATDANINVLLTSAQHTAVKQALQIAAAERELALTKRQEDINQQTAEAKAKTTEKRLTLQVEEAKQQLTLKLEQILAEAKAKAETVAKEKERQADLDEVTEKQLARKEKRDAQELSVDQRRAEIEIKAVADRFKAMSPDVVAALQNFGDQALAEKLAESLSPLAILGGKSVVEVAAKLFAGTPLAGMVQKLFASRQSEAIEK